MRKFNAWALVVILWFFLMLGIGLKACDYVKEARADEPKELTFTDKAKIAGGCCLFWFLSPSEPKKEKKIYDADGLIHDPLPKEIEKEE